MMRRSSIILLLSLLALAGCAQPAALPPFAAQPYERFSRAEEVAVALREWRLFGSVVDDDSRTEAQPEDKPERAPGLWQRVGEYWWIGLAGHPPEAAWTGKHDARGRIFPASRDGEFAWSAAFISYVMRIAGAGTRFPYSADHASYVNAAAAGRSAMLAAEAPERYAPVPGDLLCHGREGALQLRFADLPTRGHWPGHCAIVVAAGPGVLDIVGGNVADTVALSHVPVDPRGRLVDSDGRLLDRRHPWFVVVRIVGETADAPVAGR